MDGLFAPREGRYATPSRTLQSSTVKRDSLAAQLEQDPQLSSAKRTQRSDLFSAKMATKSLERKVLLAEEARRDLENQLKEKDITIQQLEGDRRWLAERETEEREEKETLQAKWASEKQVLERNVRTLRANLTTTQAAHADLEDDHSDLQRTTSSTIASQKSQIATLERQVALLQGDLALSKELAQQHKDAADRWREECEELEADRANTSRGGQEDWGVIREELHRQTTHLQSAEAVNARLTAEVHTLRSRNANIEILRQANADLEQRAKVAQAAQEKVIKLEAEVDAARKEREQWAAFIANPSSQPNSSTPASITQALSSLRLNHANLLEEQGSLATELKLRTSELASVRQKLEQTDQKLSTCEARLSDAEDQAARYKRQVEFLGMESKGLKAILETYRVEEKNHRENLSSAGDSHKDQRIELLEGTVEELKETVEELEKALDARGGPSGVSTSKLMEELEGGKKRISELEDELAELLQSNDANLDKIDTLEQKLWETGVSIHAGNHVPPNTRVVQFKFNPVREDSQLKRETLDRLKAENDALVKRLGDVETGHGLTEPGERLVPRETWESLARERGDLLQTVADKEKRLLRLKQVFTAKTDEFRETVSSILGYTLFFQPTKIRLTSAYDISAAITFSMNSKNRGGDYGTMKLLGAGSGEGGPPKLNDLIQYWIVERESIPCFMAALTLECYERIHGDATSASSMQLTRAL